MKQQNRIFLLLCVLTILLSGCSGNSITQEEVEALEGFFSVEENEQTQPVRETQPPSAEVNRMPREIISYDGNGEITSQCVFEYNAQGQLIKDHYLRYPDEIIEDYYESNTAITYDSEGRMIQRITSDKNNPNSQSSDSYTYNDSGQLISHIYSSGAYSNYITYCYDAQGRLLSATYTADEEERYTEYQYGPDGRKTSIYTVWTYLGEKSEYSAIVICDENGNVLEVVSDTQCLLRSYDTQGRLIRYEVTVEGKTEQVVEYDYTYAPFVLAHREIGESEFYSDISLSTKEGYIMWSCSVFGEIEIVEDLQGRIIQLFDKNGNSCHFYYQDEES